MEKKTPEDILESTAGHPLDAMHQYAQQEVEAYKEELASLKEENAKLKEENKRFSELIDIAYSGLSNPIKFSDNK